MTGTKSICEALQGCDNIGRKQPAWGCLGPGGRAVWGIGLSSCDLQAAGSIPVATRSRDPLNHGGFGDFKFYVQTRLWLDVEMSKRGYGRKLTMVLTSPKTPIIIVFEGAGIIIAFEGAGRLWQILNRMPN